MRVIAPINVDYMGPSKRPAYTYKITEHIGSNKISIENKKVYSISRNSEPLIEATTYVRPTLYEYFSRLTFRE